MDPWEPHKLQLNQVQGTAPVSGILPNQILLWFYDSLLYIIQININDPIYRFKERAEEVWYYKYIQTTKHLHTHVKFVYAVINFSSEFSNLIVLGWSILIKSGLYSISKGHIDKYDWSKIHTAETSIFCIELQNKDLSGNNGNF